MTAESPRIRRRVPRWRDFAPLIETRPLVFDATERRLSRAQTIDDLAVLARRRTPKSVYEYVSGAAEAEISLRRARDTFAEVEFKPQVLRDVGKIDTTCNILGSRSNLPLILAPTGFTRMMHHQGEPAVALAAAEAGIPYALSTMGTTSPTALKEKVPECDSWFQLYLWKDRDASAEVIQRAATAGYDTLVLTVDTPVAGNRLRDSRNGMTIPPTLSIRTLADMAVHPRWWVDLLTTEPLQFAALESFDGTVGELVDAMFDPSTNYDDLRWLREQWSGNLVIKGIQDLEDARCVVDLGADAVVVSNHGGRQLDRAPTPLELLPSVAAAVGDRAQIFVDTGIVTGADIVAAIGMGADACMVGRAYLYGLMAGGSQGVARAIAILAAETTRTMQLMGAQSLADTRGRVHLRQR